MKAGQSTPTRKEASLDAYTDSNLEDMEHLLSQSLPLVMKTGDILDGLVVQINKDGIVVSLGGKFESCVPHMEMLTLSKKDLNSITPGENIPVMILGTDPSSGELLLSIDKANSHIGWGKLEDLFKSGKNVSAIVTGYNKGGLTVIAENVAGFIPISHIHTPLKVNPETPDGPLSDILHTRIGDTLELKILDLNGQDKRVVLSEKLVHEDRKSVAKDRLIKELDEGSIVNGTVSSITNFGAFVDIGGADGLIHISEISWQSVDNIEEFVKIGDEISAYIINIDQENKRIALSLKRVGSQPWDNVAAKYEINQTIHGTITRLTEFGAFARIDGNIEGLVHISELSDKLVHHPKEIVKVGDTVPLRILNIEPERKRLGLSLKQADPI